MNTPIVDFLKEYSSKNTCRFHMPGHKGKARLGMENWDITEVSGADSLYEAGGIIAQSEANASSLFGSGASFYSTEGSSQCIRAMLYLIMQCRDSDTAPLILAARNVHKAFIYAAALLDIRVQWMWAEESSSVCSCPISAAELEKTLDSMEEKPAAVYITSPDYLGHMADVAALAEICHRHGCLLAVDNAHGAYLHFMAELQHPLDLGADICCDSAHKTLPVLTGGAYLHISRNLPSSYAARAKNALALFGSTSPSYLIMASLDACNTYLFGAFPTALAEFSEKLKTVKNRISQHGWRVEESDALRLTLNAPGIELAELLRERGIEPEYADNDYLVFMLTPENTEDELAYLESVLLSMEPVLKEKHYFEFPVSKSCLSIREAVMAETEIIPVSEALGRICALPMVSCPPAIPIVVSGERIGEKELKLLEYYGLNSIEVIKVPGT